jgi:ArsR family transcriptional regulator
MALDLELHAPCCGLAAAPLGEAESQRFAAMFKALGDPVRLQLASMIAATEEICVCDLTPAFELSGPTISHHLRVLREAGLVDCERRGTWVYYHVVPDALQALGRLLQPVPSAV